MRNIIAILVLIYSLAYLADCRPFWKMKKRMMEMKVKEAAENQGKKEIPPIPTPKSEAGAEIASPLIVDNCVPLPTDPNER